MNWDHFPATPRTFLEEAVSWNSQGSDDRTEGLLYADLCKRVADMPLVRRATRFPENVGADAAMYRACERALESP